MKIFLIAAIPSSNLALPHFMIGLTLKAFEKKYVQLSCFLYKFAVFSSRIVYLFWSVLTSRLKSLDYLPSVLVKLNGARVPPRGNVVSQCISHLRVEETVEQRHRESLWHTHKQIFRKKVAKRIGTRQTKPTWVLSNTARRTANMCPIRPDSEGPASTTR